MNRIMKFRAWSDKGMISEFLPCGNSQAVYIHSGNEIKIINNIILMQYTGLNDKNGKEIYEGDILVSEELKIRIEYKANAFVGIYMGEYNCRWSPLENKNYFQWEVIGNIYENPELLNK